MNTDTTAAVKASLGLISRPDDPRARGRRAARRMVRVYDSMKFGQLVRSNRPAKTKKERNREKREAREAA